VGDPIRSVALNKLSPYKEDASQAGARTVREATTETSVDADCTTTPMGDCVTCSKARISLNSSAPVGIHVSNARVWMLAWTFVPHIRSQCRDFLPATAHFLTEP